MSGNHYKGHEVSCCIKYFIFGFNILFWVRSRAHNEEGGPTRVRIRAVPVSGSRSGSGSGTEQLPVTVTGQIIGFWCPLMSADTRALEP